MDSGAKVASRWDDAYAQGRYHGEPPIPFVQDVIAAHRKTRPKSQVGLYVGCGNGRNYLPLIDAGLDLVGLDISRVALNQLAERRPDRRSSLIHGDLTALPAGVRFGVVVGIQVFQHGTEVEAHANIRRATQLVDTDGLLCLRVNAPGTQIEHPHTRIETNQSGGFTIRYESGPKAGLLIHFFARDELDRLTHELRPVVPLRCDRTNRAPPRTGYWEQWEGIWQAA